MKTKYISIGIFLFFAIGLLYSFQQIKNAHKPSTPPPPTPPATLPAPPKDTQVQGQIVVKFRQGYTPAQITEYLKQYDASIIKTIQGINYTVVKVPTGQENAIIQKMQHDPIVEKVLPDFTSHTTFVPNDELYDLQYAYNNTGQTVNNLAGKQNADIKAEEAWEVTRGAGIKVAILDSGIDLTHPDLAGKVVAQRVFVSSAIDPDISDKNGHGTHVAGIIAANTNNNIGVAGTCPDCQLIIGKVVTNDPSGNATGATSDIVSGITWAVDQGAKVVNLSLRSTSSSTQTLYQEGVDYALSKGAVVVAASGNDSSGDVTWPAGNTGVISVSATDNNDKMAPFSNYGSYVKLAAPGVFIASTFPTTQHAKKILNYGYSSGTSMSSPMVAGVAALVWATPFGTSNTAVAQRLYATADKIEGTGTQWTEGRINAAAAVGYAPSPTASPTPVPQVSAFPSINCMGGVGEPPCATIVPTEPIETLPEITQGVENPTESPNTPIEEPSIVPEEDLPLPTTPPQDAGNNQNIPNTDNKLFCLDTNNVSYTSSVDTQVQSHGHGKGHGKRGGGISQLFAMLFIFVLLLLVQMGVTIC